MEEFRKMSKDKVFDGYSRIVEEFKDYDNISRNKMIDEIIRVYSDYRNIIDICTVRELKFLKLVYENSPECEADGVDNLWEEFELWNKFLITYDEDLNTKIPLELRESVKFALENVNYEEKQKKDEINEVLVGYVKVMGSLFMYSVVQAFSVILDISEKELINHMLEDRLFRFYVFIERKYVESYGKKLPFLYYNDYYYLKDEIDDVRNDQSVYISDFDIEEFKFLFYHDFNIEKDSIKKFVNLMKSFDVYWDDVKDMMLKCVLLNSDREELEDYIKNKFSRFDVNKIIDFMNQAMDDMPSGALNGGCVNDLRKQKLKESKVQFDKEKNYTKQVGASLSTREADLFYKIYFGLLDYTNKKYNIIPKFKIYSKDNLNPVSVSKVSHEFWKNNVEIVNEFIKENPFNFDEEEIELVSGFKKCVNGTFIVSKFEKEYTAFLSDDRVYMIKGVRGNIDEIISYKDLPCMVETTLVQFGDKIIYDGILKRANMSFGVNFAELTDRWYDENMKYYHL